MDPQLGYDVFSHELRLLSQSLIKLQLIDATLNLVDVFNSVETEWPRLEILDFSNVQIACANGTWYFEVDPRVNDYEEDPQARTLDNMREFMGEDDLPAPMDVIYNPFRTVMDEDKFEKVNIATAKAVQRMPKLKRMYITFDVHGDAGWRA